MIGRRSVAFAFVLCAACGSKSENNGAGTTSASTSGAGAGTSSTVTGSTASGGGIGGAGTTSSTAATGGAGGMGGMGGSAPITPVADFALGAAHSCARTNAGAIYCWGRNQYGQIGDGTTADRNKPVKITVPGTVASFGIRMAADHSCVLESNGSLACWGRNGAGEVGDGTIVDKNVPTQLPGAQTYEQVTVGDQHTCALRKGSIDCWGSNSHGQLGVGSNKPSSSPVPLPVVMINNATELSLNVRQSCALLKSGQLSAWGEIDELTGMPVAFTAPTPIAFYAGVTHIAYGEYHLCALLGNQTVICSGSNDHGQLGNGKTGGSYTMPVPVMNLSGVIAIASGFQMSCALKQDGTVLCWGLNGAGQLGDGTTADHNVPTPVKGLSGAVAIAAGGYHAGARKGDGSLWLWGGNGNGQLGDGTTTNSSVPIQVAF